MKYTIILLLITITTISQSFSFQSILSKNARIRQKSNMPSTKLHMGLLDGLKKIVTGGSANIEENLLQENEQVMKTYQSKVDRINKLEPIYELLSNDDLRKKTDEFKERIKDGESLDGLLEEAYAVAREASWRILQMRHFDVQLIGGMALHDGRLAEMATGEGKTLVAVLPLYLNALSGDGSLIVTTNDYLARRDGEMMGQVFRFLGLSVGIIQSYHKEDTRRSAYNCDITYVSNQELGFDYLRDNLAISINNVVQIRPYNFCIVDEADSILIDEARTPLIISRIGKAPQEKYLTCAQIAKKYLVKGQHYDVIEKDSKIELTSQGFKYCEQLIGKSLYDLNDPWAFYIINALKAKEILLKDREYVIAPPPEGKEDMGPQIAIVDSFTGRVLEGRRFTDGLQQSLEAKENLKISGETQVVAKVTYQSLFKLFPKLSGMTGTASTDLQEFYDIYELKVITIPTALPVARRDNPDAVFRTKNGKMKALLRNVLSTHDKGRPILIGTTSVESSEEIYQALKDIELTNVKILNARPENIERESEIVAQAGRIGSITVATNMAGRGTDIILGGSAKGLIKSIAKWYMLLQLGLVDSISVISAAAEKEKLLNDKIESKKATEASTIASTVTEAVVENNDPIDEFKAATSRMETSTINNERSKDKIIEEMIEEEEIIEGADDPDVLALPSIDTILTYLDLSLPKGIKKSIEIKLKQAVISCTDMLLEQNSNRLSNTLSTMQAVMSIDRVMVEDIVSKASEASPISDPAIKLLRSAMLKAINVLEKDLENEKERVKKLGGLYVIGTARHESRRIDLQLRGRAGRQGDPGGSRFFLSLEDDIFKIFGADKLTGIMENFRVSEDMPIESDLVVQALNKVQNQVEDYYRAIRRQVYKLDEITAAQRAVVYTQRRAFLTSSDDGMTETFTKYCQQTMQEIYEASLLPSGSSSNSGNLMSKTKASIGGPVDSEKLLSKSLQFFPNLQLSLTDIKGTANNQVLSLLQSRLLNAIERKRAEIDDSSVNSFAFLSFVRYLALVQTDESWCKQLTRLDILKEEMVLQSFTADRDVVEVYRERAMKLFETLLDDVRRNTVYSLFIYKPKK